MRLEPCFFPAQGCNGVFKRAMRLNIEGIENRIVRYLDKFNPIFVNQSTHPRADESAVPLRLSFYRLALSNVHGRLLFYTESFSGAVYSRELPVFLRNRAWRRRYFTPSRDPLC
jgi:hypothetical protein